MNSVSSGVPGQLVSSSLHWIVDTGKLFSCVLLRYYQYSLINFRVLKIAEVYDYDDWEQFETDAPNTGLFTEYINSFLRSKQEVSQLVLVK